MLNHHVAMALRGFVRNPLPTGLSVVVLALGVACFMAAYLFVSHLRGFDSHFPNADRIRVIMQSMEAPLAGLSVPLTPGSALPLADQLRLDAPELEAVARYSILGRGVVTVDGEPSYRRIAYAEPEFAEIFRFDALAGDPGTALATPRSAIVTEETAERLFGTADAVGRTFEVTEQSSVDVTVAAVIAELPRASHLSRRSMTSRGFELLLSWDVFETAAMTEFLDSWGNLPVLTYALMPEGGGFTVDELDRRLVELGANHIPEEFSWGRFAFESRPVSEIATRTLQTSFQGFYGADWAVDVFDALLLFAGAILAVACLNFVNLATAESAFRARAIGTRKVLGATAGSIIRQELLRTTLLVAGAFVLAVAAIVAAGRLLDSSWANALAVPWWREGRYWLFVAAALPAIAAAAGLYPALVLARVRAATALRLGASRGGSRTLRTLLVGLQFGTAGFLLVAVVVVFSQRDTLRALLLDRFDDPYVVLNPLLPTRPGGPAVDTELFATELLRHPAVTGVTTVNQFPFQASPGGRRYRREPSEDAPAVNIGELRIGHDYFDVMEFTVAAGRVFSRERADDGMPTNEEEFRARRLPPRIVIDGDAARALGWARPAEAVGEAVYTQGSNMPAEIIGVVDSVPASVRSSDARGLAWFLQPRFASIHVVRLAQDDVAAGLEHIERAAAALLPGRPPAGHMFLDDAFERAYWTFDLMNRVFAALAVLAITISGAGLYGMAGFMTERRTREIGLRKTQGATSGRILRLLLLDFSKPVLAANVLVWPLAFIAAERYLDLFAARTALTPVPFLVALLGTLAIAWLAVSRHVLRAAALRPTEALRHE